MGISLKAITEHVPTSQCTVGGVQFEMRALRGRERHQIFDLLGPPPKPTKQRKGQVPGKPGRVKYVPDEEDPEYVAQKRDWWTMYESALLGVACDFTVAVEEGGEEVPWSPDFTPEQARAWAAAQRRYQEDLPGNAEAALKEKLAKLNDFEGLVEDAWGKSSGLPNLHPPAATGEETAAEQPGSTDSGEDQETA